MQFFLMQLLIQVLKQMFKDEFTMHIFIKHDYIYIAYLDMRLFSLLSL